MTKPKLYRPGPILYSEYGYNEATWEQKAAVVNGCGPAGKFDFVPDNILGCSIKAACFIHDWMYEHGEMEEDRLRADRVFLNNMIRIIKHYGMVNRSWKWITNLRLKLAWKYYQAVARFGGPAFWAGNNNFENETEG